MVRKSNHGGKRPGAGRPRKENPRTERYCVAVTGDELELLKRTEAVRWAREVLLKSAKRRAS